MVSATQHTGIEGEVITLTCEATTDPFKVTSELEPYITIEWTGPLWTDENILTLSPQMQSSVGMIRTLTINTTAIDHAGMYTCRVILNGTRFFPLESVAKYHLVLKSKTEIQSCVMPCSQEQVIMIRGSTFSCFTTMTL